MEQHMLEKEEELLEHQQTFGLAHDLIQELEV